MSVEFLKALLQYDFYNKHKSSLSSDLVPKTYTDIYDSIVRSHEVTSTNLTVDSLRALHKSFNPTMSRAKEEALEPLYKNIEDCVLFDEKIQDTLINNILCKRIADEIATVAIDLADGKETKSVEDLQILLDKLKNIKSPVSEQEDNRINVRQLIEAKKIDLKWQFNYLELANRIKGMGGGYFGVIAARPDAGKTSFYMALTCAPEGLLEQGAVVHIIGNEESVDRLKFRALSAMSGKTQAYVEANIDEIEALCSKYNDQLYIADGLGMTMTQVDNYVAKNKLDVLIIDQLDKMGVSGSANLNDVERLKRIYIQARNIAKKHNCMVIGICQAGAGAHNKLYYGFEQLDGSKTGKAAECDWCITIGMEVGNGQGDNGYRIANIPKNKLGKKQPVPFMLETDICRIHA